MNRIRQRDLSRSPSFRWQLVKDPDNLIQDYTYDAGSKSLGSTKIVLDTRTTNFVPGVTFRLNEAEFRSVVGTSSPGEISWYGYYNRIRGTRKVSGDLLAFGEPGLVYPPATQWDTDASNRALHSSFAGMNKPAADVGMMLAELPQAIGLLTSPVKSIGRMGKAFWSRYKTRQRKKPTPVGSRTSALAYASDKWVEFRYGVLPLISDVEALRNSVNVMMTKDMLGFSTGAVYTQETVYHPRRQKDFGELRITYDEVQYLNNFVTAKCYYRNRITQSANLGVGIFDIPNLLWELIPYSFVVDWFFNVGDWLRAIQPNPDRVFMGNCVSLKQESIQKFTMVDATFWPYAKPATIHNAGHYDVTTQNMWRRVNLPVPSTPALNLRFESVAHAIDAAALVVQRSRSKWPKVFRY